MKKPMTSKRELALVVCGVTLLSIAAYALTIEPQAQGRIGFLDRFDGPADVFIDKLTLEPGDTIPWHYHGGETYVVVKRGTVTFTDGCGNVTQYSAGDAFFEEAGHVHQVSNQGTEQNEFYGTIIAPAGSPPVTFVGGPGCGPPTRAEQCKNGGWIDFNYPRTFNNQGDCIQFVNTGK